MSYDSEQLRRIIEGAILAAGEALSVDRLHSLFEEHEAPEKSEIRELLQVIAQDCDGRGFQLVEVASGWRFQVREDVAPWVNRLWEEKPQKYSRAMLETLALIAYRQPITRGDIEDVRGVAVSSHIIKTLVEREWVKVVGHRDVPGRPSLYATTRQFLDYFNLKSLDELPTLSELKDIDSLNGSLDLGDGSSAAGEGEADEDAGAEDVADLAASGEEQSQEPLDGSQVIDPEEMRDEDTVVGDALVEDEAEEEALVEAADIPFELDDEVGQPKNDEVPDAEPTIEQEELAQSQSEDHDPDAQASDDEHR